MLDQNALNLLKGKSSILAFSHGVDSTALFYLLVNQNIDFDLAFVNYNTRKESILEENEAINLAKKFNKKIFVKKVNLNLEKSSNFEKIARDLRYEFFDEIFSKFDYKFLITAHNLNDLFEWFLMRISKGAGLCNALGMSIYDKKENLNIIRPLLYTSRDEILNFLNENHLKYFIDSSNKNTKFQRNFIRENFSNEFVRLYKKGLENSLKFMQKDKEILQDGLIYENLEFFIIKNQPNSINLIDKILKKFGIVMSQKQRNEAIKDTVISGKITISYKDDKIYITPYKKEIMTKKFKEICRVKKVPKLIRGYISTHQNLLKYF